MTYSGSPNSYFRQLPDLDYPSLANDRTSVYDYRIVKNIFKRAVMRDDIFNDVTAFTKYSVQGDERADQIAESFYGDSGLDLSVVKMAIVKMNKNAFVRGNANFLFADKVLHLPSLNEIRDLVLGKSAKKRPSSGGGRSDQIFFIGG